MRAKGSLFKPESTISTFPVPPKPLSIFWKSLVLWLSSGNPSTTATEFSTSLAESADRRAPRSFLRGKRVVVTLWACGPWTVPPCRHKGLRMLPIRARPVPFWRHSFLPLPLTSPRTLVAGRPGSKRVIVVLHGLPDEGLVEFRFENLIGKLQLADYLIGKVFYFNLRHHQPLPNYEFDDYEFDIQIRNSQLESRHYVTLS